MTRKNTGYFAWYTTVWHGKKWIANALNIDVPKASKKKTKKNNQWSRDEKKRSMHQSAESVPVPQHIGRKKKKN